MSKTHRHRAGLVLIAAYKLFAALLLVGLGVGALRLLHKDVSDVLWHALIDVRHWNPESRMVNYILEKAELVDDPMLKRIGGIAFFYAFIGVVEAVGLYLEQAWAEFLTVLITASFLPFEIHEVIRRVTWGRVGILAINVTVLVYLVYLLIEKAMHRARAERMAADKV